MWHIKGPSQTRGAMVRHLWHRCGARSAPPRLRRYHSSRQSLIRNYFATPLPCTVCNGERDLFCGRQPDARGAVSLRQMVGRIVLAAGRPLCSVSRRSTRWSCRNHQRLHIPPQATRPVITIEDSCTPSSGSAPPLHGQRSSPHTGSAHPIPRAAQRPLSKAGRFTPATPKPLSPTTHSREQHPAPSRSHQLGTCGWWGGEGGKLGYDY